MARVSAARELLASREDAWRFVAEPHHFADWWPDVSGVHPDRRGLAEGARWQLTGSERPSLLRKGSSNGVLLVRSVRPPECFAWTLSGDHLDVELRLEESGPERTLASLEVEAPWLVGLSRSLPRRALTRLHALCQTGAGL